MKSWYKNKKKCWKLVIGLLFIFTITSSSLFFPIFVNAQASQPASTKGTLETIGDVASGTWTFGSALANGADFLLGGIANLFAKGLNTTANWMMTASGFLLDQAIAFSLDSGNFKFPALEHGWTIFRDVANATFIFLLLYIGIATILQLTSVNTKRAIVTLIVVALLLNFSFFLTGIIIDASNIMSRMLYNIITSDGTKTISEQFGIHLNFKSFFNETVYQSIGYGKTALMNFVGAILFFMVAFIFISASLMFIARTVVFMFLLLLSPLAFAACAVPNTYSWFQKWLHYLTNYSLFAPVYLLGILVILQMIPSIFTRVPGGKIPLSNASQSVIDAAAAAGGVPGLPASGFDIFFGFLLVAGLLVGVLSISKSLAGEAANILSSFVGKAAGLTVMAGAATAGFVGRRFIGRYASDKARDKEFTERKGKEIEKGGLRGWYAKQQLKTVENLGKASFDARGGKVGKAFGGIGGMAQGLGVGTGLRIDPGRAQSGGYEAKIKEETEKARKFNEKFGLTKQTDEETKALARAQVNIDQKEKELKKAEEELKDANSGFFAGDTTAAKELVKTKEEELRLQKDILKTTQEQVEERKKNIIENIIPSSLPDNVRIETIEKLRKPPSEKEQLKKIIEEITKENPSKETENPPKSTDHK